MSKITLTFFLITFSVLQIAAQQVTETVDFDNYNNISDNDLVNWFSGGNGLTQITTNGIQGGCLQTPDSINWGNDEANYCFKYHNLNSAGTSTRFCFKYDSTLTNLPSYARCASIWIKPSADFNHYVIASVSHQKKIEILSYSWTNNGAPSFSLIHGNWYQLVLFLTYSGSTINTSVDIFDLGSTGLFAPSLVDHQFGSITDSIFCNDTSVTVGISGSRKGGAQYIDNFKFIGEKSSDSCAYSIPNVVNDISVNDNFIFSYNNNQIQLTNNSSPVIMEIINVEGQIILSRKMNEIFSFNTAHLPSGIYFLKATNAEGNFLRKFVVN